MERVRAALAHGIPIDQGLLSQLARQALREAVNGQTEQYPLKDLSDFIDLWPRLVQTVHAKNISEKHLTTACNAVSVYLASTHRAENSDLRAFVLSTSVWASAYDCAQHAFSCGKTKPALQVLETLAILANEHPDEHAASRLLWRSAESLISTIIIGEPQSRIKASCIFLSCLSKKTSLRLILPEVIGHSLRQHLQQWQIRCNYHGLSTASRAHGLTALQELLLALLFAIKDLETRSAALKLFSQLCAGDRWSTTSQTAEGAQVLELFIQANQDSLGDIADNVLPVLLDTENQFREFHDLYSPLRAYSESKVVLYLAVLTVGRLKSFITEDGMSFPIRLPCCQLMCAELPELLNQNFGQSSDPRNSYHTLDLLLQAGDTSIRIHAYNLITASFATRALVPQGTLLCLLRNFRFLHDDNDAYERGEVLSTTRRLLKRLDGSYSSLQKQQTAESALQLHPYVTFVRRFADFLSQELELGVSYQRHIMALTSMRLLLDTSFNNWHDDSLLHKRLSILVLDAYDDVRSISADLLSRLQHRLVNNHQLLRPALLQKTLKLAASTCRQDHADAAGRFIAIYTWQARPSNENTCQADMLVGEIVTSYVEQLTEHLNSVTILKPDSGFPLHAYLLGLSHALVSTSGPVQASRILSVCSRIWQLVQSELCVDSPETGTEDAEDEEFTGPKDLLAYSWRALKDSSTLLQAVIRSDHYLDQVGDLCMEQLRLLRHRGAFSTVAQTFVACCDRARSSTDAAIRNLVRRWYMYALREIDAQAAKVTRRSAGLPAMFNAILSPSEEAMFDEAVQSLKLRSAVYSQTSLQDQSAQALPQVHALNCIKDLIVNAKFRAVTERYINEMLVLAAERMSLDIWAIRNCGLMLMRACINRMNRQDDTMEKVGHSGSLSSDSESPVTVAMQLLYHGGDRDEVRTTRTSSEQTFAGLDLAKHAGPAGNLEQKLRGLVLRHLTSRTWAIRDHAALVLATRLATTLDWTQVLAAYPIKPEADNNELHGMLLFYGYLYQLLRTQMDDATLGNVVSTVSQIVEALSERRSDTLSPFTTAALFSLVNQVLHSVIAHSRRSIDVSYLAAKPDAWSFAVTSVPSYCAERVALSRIYIYLITPAPANLESSAFDLPVLTEAGATYVAASLAVLTSDLPSNTHQPRLQAVLLHLARTTSDEDTAATLMLTIATAIEAGKLLLTSENAMKLLTDMKRFELPGRDAWNAILRLKSSLLTSIDNTDGSVAPLLSGWADDIVYATRDEVENPTRLNAAKAVRNWAKFCALPSHDRTGVKTLNLMLMAVVYDQLNDDDEDIRQVAQHTAQLISSSQAAKQEHSRVRLCAVSARTELLQSMQRKYGTTQAFSRVAVHHIVGCREGSATQPIQISVCTRLHDLVSSMNDLFAEEKQNLYIDELDEVQRWAAALSMCSIDVMGAELWQSVGRWALDGLVALTPATTTSSLHGEDHGLGVTFHVGVLELCVRVIQLSTALLSMVGLAETQDAAVQSIRAEMREQLSVWRVTLDEDGSDVHPLLSASLDDKQ